jgi:hypothetical protein
MSDDQVNCGSGGGSDSHFHLRIASVFIIFIGSMSGALFPVVARRTTWLAVPNWLFECVVSSFYFPAYVRRVAELVAKLCQVFWLRRYC